MVWLFLKLHALVIWCVFWSARLVGRTVWAFILAVLALINEEWRRWIGLTIWGVLILASGKLALRAPVGRTPLLLTVLLLMGIWALAVRRAAHLTRVNSLVKVRNRQAIRGMASDVAVVRQRVGDGLARATWGSPVQSAFRQNRDRADREAKAEATKERAARDAELQRLMDEERLVRERAAGFDPDDGF